MKVLITILVMMTFAVPAHADSKASRRALAETISAQINTTLRGE